MSTPLDQPQGKFIQLADLNLHYLEWGRLDSPPLVLLHGFGDTAWLYKRVAKPFEKNYHLFSLDLRGHGETTTDQADRQPQRALVADLANFLEALDLREVVLVGYSYGGTIVYRYVAQHPERVKALAIIDIGVENTEITFTGTGTPAQITASIERAWQAFKQISCPTLLIKAEQSHLLQQAVAEKMVESIPQGKLVVIEGIDHKIFKRYDALAETLQNFLETI